MPGSFSLLGAISADPVRPGSPFYFLSILSAVSWAFLSRACYLGGSLVRVVIRKEQISFLMEMNVKATQYSRRRFLVMGCGALCAAALGTGCAAHQVQGQSSSSCPFGKVNDAYPGKCHRYLDANQDGFCDLGGVGMASATETEEGAEPDALAEETEADAVGPAWAAWGATTGSRSRNARAVTSGRCPRGLVDDPYPGRCHHYVDRNGNGYCDLSQIV
jgi:hypothetical protein